MGKKYFSYGAYFLTVAIIISYLRAASAEAREMKGYVGLDQGELGKNEWVLCGRAELDGRCADVSISDSAYIERLPDREDFFIIRKDRLLWTGYHIGRRLGVLADNPVYVFGSKDFTVDSTSVAFHSIGRLDVNSVIEEQGNLKWNVEGYGRLLISPSDTLRNVILTRQVVQSRMIIADSVAELEQRVIYRWYDTHSIEPVAIQCNDELFVDVDLVECLSADECDGGNENPERIQRIIDSATVEYDDAKVVVRTEEPINLNVYIMDVAGNIYVSASGLSDRFELLTTDLPLNQYIISIVSDSNPLYTRKILYQK